MRLQLHSTLGNARYPKRGEDPIHPYRLHLYLTFEPWPVPTTICDPSNPPLPDQRSARELHARRYLDPALRAR
jgi:hypothetical protein